MKKLPIIFLLTVMLLAATGFGSGLTTAEKALIKQKGIPEGLALDVKKEAASLFIKTEYKALAGNEDGPKVNVPGIVIQLPEKKVASVLGKFSDAAAKNGCFIFRCAQNFGVAGKPDEIAIIKTTDQYDILRVMATDGANYDIATDMIIKKFKTWEKSFTFRINGAELDWVSAEFITLPKDMLAFAREVYKFCPDVVEQGTGTVEALAEEMKKTKTLYMWWD